MWTQYSTYVNWEVILSNQKHHSPSSVKWICKVGRADVSSQKSVYVNSVEQFCQHRQVWLEIQKSKYVKYEVILSTQKHHSLSTVMWSHPVKPEVILSTQKHHSLSLVKRSRQVRSDPVDSEVSLTQLSEVNMSCNSKERQSSSIKTRCLMACKQTYLAKLPPLSQIFQDRIIVSWSQQKGLSAKNSDRRDWRLVLSHCFPLSWDHQESTHST